MTVQPVDSLEGAMRPQGAGMSAQEQEVIRHLTAAWAAFLQLPTERVEYVLAFQSGCQELQRQISERPSNRMAAAITIPVITPIDPGVPSPYSRLLDTRTPLEKIRDRHAKQNARHKKRREEQRAADPAAWRAKEREKWQRRKERENAILVEASHVRQKTTAPATSKAEDTPPQKARRKRASDLKPPPGLTAAGRVKWLYHNDPQYRANLLQINREWRKKVGFKQKTKRTAPEAYARAKARRDYRIQTEPEYADRVRERKRINNARYRAALKALARSKAKEASGEVRIRHLRADPIYSAAHAALPAAMAPHHRADIVSDIIMAVLEGQITLEEVPKKAKSFITAHHRRSETYSTVSLDAPIGDGKVTMHDFATEGLWSSMP